jgi:hypothetical protein
MRFITSSLVTPLCAMAPVTVKTVIKKTAILCIIRNTGSGSEVGNRAALPAGYTF